MEAGDDYDVMTRTTKIVLCIHHQNLNMKFLRHFMPLFWNVNYVNNFFILILMVDLLMFVGTVNMVAIFYGLCQTFSLFLRLTVIKIACIGLIKRQCDLITKM